MEKEKIEVKLDRVTVVGSFLIGPDELDDIFYEQKWQKSYTRDNDTLYELHRRTGDVDEIKAVVVKNPHQTTWRLDTSNHLDEGEKRSVRRILLLMKDKHLSRIDVAFDFINCKFAGMRHRIFKPNVSTSEIYFTKICGRGKQIETIYAGRRKSLSQIRYYDKKRERKAAKQPIADDIESWERLEIQLRGRRSNEWISRSKEMLECFKLPIYKKIEKVSTRLMLQNLVDHPENLALLPERTKVRYRKLIKENQGFDTSYAEQAQLVLEKNAQKIANEVNSFLIELSEKMD